ncbi:type II toxin-antitoxin system HipA family toxin [Enterovibrio sp. ZSDZ42]|uniref:Type II toxin-antitoxin system HipA family toxin n=1 Tax=Enterovibrio gelatinilyticus TaxID=2899819 RepID=A0ABT5QXL1_9GAMM|nr:type II toxin-antitoxin system HipA family toxin [Enterovibrio sp. ZSDZ42]MDD1792755.1 type II toxin-antitoxin system HipA family toxin [Enterovibrio sp. ZSDZ42]
METLVAYMNGERVGEFMKLSNGAHEFQYDAQWIENPKGRPLSLSLPLQYQKHASSHVINYFDNLLPDLNEIRDRIVARYQADSRQAFDLLKQVGKDSVGAIALYDPNEDTPTFKQLEYDVLTNERLEKVLSAYKANIPLGMLSDEDDFRISVAGAQEKTALLKLGNDWCIPKNATPTTHIIKLPIGKIKQPDATLDMSDSVENEYLCLLLAKALGLNVPNAEIIHCNDIKALAVERFDRRWSKDEAWLLRLPQEDMCQAFGKPSAIKYESDGGVGIKDIMKLLLGSSNALEDRDAFMRFQVFQWIIGATDGHAKNFSIFLGAGGSYQLTPFYDILSAYPILGGKGLHLRSLKLAMGLKANKGRKYKLDKIFARHFLATAKEVGFSTQRMQAILDEFAKQLPSAIKQVKQQLPEAFPEHVSMVIFEQSLKMVGRVYLAQ